MKKVLIAFIALTAAAALWLALDPDDGPDTARLPGNGGSSTVTWEWLSLVLPGEFEERDGSVRWRGGLDGQTIDAGGATLRSAPGPSDELQVRAKFAAQEFFGNLTFGLPADQLSAPDPNFTWLKLRANSNLKSPLGLTPWLSIAGKLGLDADAGGGKAIPVAATIKLTGRDPQFIAALPDMSGQLASATFDSFTANATLDAHAVEITEFVATGPGIRMTGSGRLSLAPSYEESSIDFTLEVARSNATTQPVLAQAYAGLAQTNSYQVGLHGSLARPQVLINGFPIDPTEGPVVLPAGTPGSVHSPTSRRATARPHAKDRTPHTTRGGAQGHARGRAPLPWPSDSPQAQRFEELWATYQLEFETLADEGQTVRGLTRKQLKRQVIDQVREEFAESVEQ